MAAVMHADPSQLTKGQARAVVALYRNRLDAALQHQAEAAAFNLMLRRRLSSLSTEERVCARIAWTEALAYVKAALPS